MVDYEKLYKETLAKAREIHRNEDEKRFDMEWLFPELKYSEDERVRNALIRFHKSTIDVDGIKGDDILAWLEKQGELPEGCVRKTAAEAKEALFDDEDEKIRKELIFYLGDMPEDTELRNGVTNRDVLVWLEKQESVREIVERCKNSWYNEGRIAGMAEGLTDNEKYQQGWHDAFEKQGEQNTNHKTMIVKFICKKDWHGIGDYYYGKIYNGYPCEKEQKGYDIYDDNDIPIFCDKDFINEYFNIITEEKQGKQKPVEDKDAERASADYRNFRMSCGINDPVMLNEIEEAYYEGAISRKPKEWNEEDERNLNGIIDEIQANKSNAPSYDIKTYDRFLNWLKSLKDRMQGKEDKQ